MAKQQSSQRIKMYNPSTYRSVEQKVMGALEPIGKELFNFLYENIKTTYGGFAAPFRIPTIARRYNNDQFPLFRIGDLDYSFGGRLGTVMGLIVGAFATFSVPIYAAIEATVDGNYVPAMVLGATNLASGLYEIGRRDKSKQEYLGLQKFKEWEQKKVEEKKKVKKKKK